MWEVDILFSKVEYEFQSQRLPNVTLVTFSEAQIHACLGQSRTWEMFPLLFKDVKRRLRKRRVEPLPHSMAPATVSLSVTQRPMYRKEGVDTNASFRLKTATKN